MKTPDLWFIGVILFFIAIVVSAGVQVFYINQIKQDIVDNCNLHYYNQLKFQYPGMNYNYTYNNTNITLGVAGYEIIQINS